MLIVADDVRTLRRRDRRQPRGERAGWRPRPPDLLIHATSCARCWPRSPGSIQTARLSAADPSFVGNLIELSAITAVVVGGTPLSGGRVRIVGTLAGAMLMQLIAATLITHNLPDSATRMVQAVIILAAVFIQRERTA